MSMQEGDELADFRDIPDFVEPSPPAVGLPALSKDAPVRAAVQKRRWVALCSSAAWLAVHLAIYGVRSDFRELPLVYTAAQILIPFGFALSSLGLALSSGRLGLGLRVGMLVLVCILGPLSFMLIAIGAPAPRPTPADEPFWLSMLVCFDTTLAWAVVPLAAAAFALRRAFAAGAMLRAGLVGAACGLASGATMNLHCPSVVSTHILLGHGIPVILATLVGALLMARWLKS